MKLSSLLAAGLMQTVFAAPDPRHRCSKKPAAFYLAGDSTTATVGGWGDPFVRYLVSPATGANFAKSGATTVDFVSGGHWARVLDAVRSTAQSHDVYVTIQFGHNDQKAEKNITLDDYQGNLERLAGEVRAAGGTPLLVTSLTRRAFSGGLVVQNLANERNRTIAAAKEVRTPYIDLNKASTELVQALGQAEADKFNLEGPSRDRTHLNLYGERVFATLVADLVTKKLRCVEKWIEQEEDISEWIWETIETGTVPVPVEESE
ncbi:SGNH hydrolase-type esterase domain-containing protein [Plectosphaerella plurivora]|uniref:SGNH hydrolase-type esterase domain-containing protein n=1 Tax=Plectosphaerella plurivora TaxID=936078 RepID=A0A9P8VHC8_9PEZI|nr:SGNH hydrolase-type esterase domain-containing protein [Plectosphaerella plurivora]